MKKLLLLLLAPLLLMGVSSAATWTFTWTFTPNAVTNNWQNYWPIIMVMGTTWLTLTKIQQPYVAWITCTWRRITDVISWTVIASWELLNVTDVTDVNVYLQNNRPYLIGMVKWIWSTQCFTPRQGTAPYNYYSWFFAVVWYSPANSNPYWPNYFQFSWNDPRLLEPTYLYYNNGYVYTWIQWKNIYLMGIGSNFSLSGNDLIVTYFQNIFRALFRSH
jgi:hypothetical protein